MSDTVVRKLYVPDLKELAHAIQTGLATNFKEVSVSVVDCPNLTQAPYHLASPGFGGKTVVADIGGVLNMEFLENTNKYHFDLKQIQATTHVPFFIGAGATKPDVALAKDNSEWMPNANVKTGVSKSKEAYVDKTGNCCLADHPSTEFSSLCNLFGSEGTPNSKVLKIVAKVRTGKKDFPGSIRQAVVNHYPTQQIGLGGAFIIKKGKIVSHVMPGFPPCDVFGKDIPWLKFFEVDAPLTCLSVLLSSDPHKDEARLEHTHFYSSRPDAGGHYHYDITPETVEYEGYYAVAEEFHRIAKAKKPAKAAL